MFAYFVIAWLWVVGIPLAYYAMANSRDDNPTWLVVTAHVWPVTAPLFVVVYMLAKRATKNL